jgi:hypothetical protein
LPRLDPVLARSTAVLATTVPPALLLARSLPVVVAHPRAVPDGLRLPFAGALAAALALAVGALALELAAARRGRARGTARVALGRGAVLAVASWLAVLALQSGDYAAWRADAVLALALGVHALLLALDPRLARRVPARVRRVLWLAGLELAAAVVLLEIGLRAAARATGLQLLQTARYEAERAVREAHLPPYGRWVRGTLNGRGFLDEEFGPRVPERARVLVIGDSFSVGPVPYTHHYTAVAERELDGVEICNVGVPRIGPDEYLVLYRDEVAALEPDLVVIAFFVGNDLFDVHLRRGGDSLARRLLDRRLCLVFEVPRRLGLLRGHALPELRAAGESFEPLTIAEAERRLPHLTDPLLEVASLGERAYREIESGRAGFLERAHPGDFERALAPLLELRALAAPVPVVLLVLPDEYQVEDDVWRGVCEDLGRVPRDRDRPQRELARLCADADLPVRDTLPALRAVEPLADGRRHVYHLRDTHFNARGNRVVGAELAQLVRERLPHEAWTGR